MRLGDVLSVLLMATLLGGCSSSAVTVDRVNVFEVVKRIADDRVFLVVDPPPADEPYLRIEMSVRGRALRSQAAAAPGETISVQLIELLGAGAHWFDFRGFDREGYAVFDEHTWFYDVVRETHRRIRVKPYGDPLMSMRSAGASADP